MTNTPAIANNSKLPTVVTAEYFDKIRSKWMQQGDEASFAREISFALQHLNRNKKLKECTAQSVMESVLNITQIGLTLNPALKLAHLVPRYTNGALQCNLEASYQGLVKLITDTGSCKKIYAHPVMKGDTFAVKLGTELKVEHTPQYTSKIVEKVYAIGVLQDGTIQVEVMTSDEIDAIRDNSESYKAFKENKIKTTPWDSHYNEMARKTVIRRLCKYLPKTEAWEHVAKAIQLDEADYRASTGQIGYLDNLIATATIPEERKENLYLELDGMNSSRASELITELKEKQVGPLDGPGMGAAEVNEAVREKMDDPNA